VVRLKGGDPFVFGRGAEECGALVEAGVPFEVVPGVSAATAVPAYAGIPLTARGIASTVALATGHEADDKALEAVDWSAVARAGTIVLFMALRAVEDCARRLVAAGRDPATPAAAIYWGTTARQRTVVARLDGLAAAVAAAGLRPPALLVVGEVVALRDRLCWHERRPLAGARVLVPRPRGQSEPFADAVAHLGGEPVIAPVVRIAPPAQADAELVARAIAHLGDYAWVFLTSANAANRFLAELTAARRDVRALGRALLACVGRATAAALESRGLLPDLVAEEGGAAAADALVAAAGGSLRGARVLHPRAEQGREEAVARLRAAGAEVDLVPVYRTEPVAADDPALRRALALLAAGELEVAAFFAPSQVSALCAILGERAAAQLSACTVIAAIGGTTAGALRERGIRVDVVSPTAAGGALAAAIAARYRHQES
jgi:uroporphyrinogen III methyltransferase/synthase